MPQSLPAGLTPDAQAPLVPHLFAIHAVVRREIRTSAGTVRRLVRTGTSHLPIGSVDSSQKLK